MLKFYLHTNYLFYFTKLNPKNSIDLKASFHHVWNKIKTFSYGIVSFGLICTGLVFTVFAIFQKDSQIGKVWLAGPCAMVVGLVLCGKVIIDWGPAMLHGRQGSIDSTFIEQYQLGLPNGDTKFSLPRTPIIMDNKQQQYFQYNGDLIPMPPSASLNAGIPQQQYASINHFNSLNPSNNQMNATTPQQHLQMNKVSQQVRMQNLSPNPIKSEFDLGMDGAIDCIVYGQFDSASDSNASSYTALPNEIPHDQLQKLNHHSTIVANTNAIQQFNSYQNQFPRHKRRISAPAQCKNLTLQPMSPNPPEFIPTCAQNYNQIMENHQQLECNCAHFTNNRYTASSDANEQLPQNQQKKLFQNNSNSNSNHDYGSTGETYKSQQQRSNSPSSRQQQLLYQGETFVINERSYFI